MGSKSTNAESFVRLVPIIEGNLTLICSTLGRWNLRSKQWLARLLILGWLRSLHMQTTGMREPLSSWMSSATPPLSSFPAIPSTSSINKIWKKSSNGILRLNQRQNPLPGSNLIKIHVCYLLTR